MIKSQDSEVPRHELDNRPQADHRRANADTGKPQLSDRRVDDAHLAEFLEQTFGDFICALIDADLLAHEEDAVIALHLLTKSLIEGVAVSNDWHEKRGLGT